MTLTLSYTTLIVDLPTGNSNLAKQKIKKQKFWQLFKIILYRIIFYIQHQMWVSCEEQYFPIHLMKPCQEDWQKLVFKEKIVLFQRNLSSLLLCLLILKI